MAYNDITKTGVKGLKGIRNLDLYNKMSSLVSSGNQDALEFLNILGDNRLTLFGEGANPNAYFKPVQDIQGSPWEDLGLSSYDPSFMMGNDPSMILENRALQQPAAMKLINGTLKGIITAGTTFADSTIGLINGIGLGIYNLFIDDDPNTDFMQGMWDNATNRAVTSILEDMEKVLPNYYSKDELENPWYNNVFSANFWGDKFIKNMGFTVGALGAMYFTGGAGALTGKLATSGLKMIAGASRTLGASMKTVANLNKTARVAGELAGMAVNTALSASGEASIEAINAVNEAKKVALLNLDIRFNELYNLLDPNSPTYSLDLQDLVNAKKEYEALLNGGLLDVGNSVWLANMGILSLSNSLLFGKILRGGFKNSSRLAAHSYEVAGKSTDLKGFARAFLTGEDMKVVNGLDKSWSKVGIHLLKNTVSEGWEEGAQRQASDTKKTLYLGKLNKDSVDSLLGVRINPGVSEELAEYEKAFSRAYSDAFGGFNKDGWEEVFLGALTGAIGSPSMTRRYLRDSLGRLIRDTKGQPVKKLKFVWSGGWKEAYDEVAEPYKENLEYINLLNEKLADLDFRKRTLHVISQLLFARDMDNALDEGDMFKFKNSEIGSIIEDALFFADKGMLDEYMQFYKDLTNIDDLTLELIYNATKDENGESPLERNLIEANRALYLDKAKSTLEKIQKVIDYYNYAEELFTKFPLEFKEELAWHYARLDDTRTRIKKLKEKNSYSGIKHSLVALMHGEEAADDYEMNNTLSELEEADLEKLKKREKEELRKIKEYEKRPEEYSLIAFLHNIKNRQMLESMDKDKIISRLKEAKSFAEVMQILSTTDESIYEDVFVQAYNQGDKTLLDALENNLVFNDALRNLHNKLSKVFKGINSTMFDGMYNYTLNLFKDNLFNTDKIHNELVILRDTLNNRDPEGAKNLLNTYIKDEETVLSIIDATIANEDDNLIDILDSYLNDVNDEISINLNAYHTKAKQAIQNSQRAVQQSLQGLQGQLSLLLEEQQLLQLGGLQQLQLQPGTRLEEAEINNTRRLKQIASEKPSLIWNDEGKITKPVFTLGINKVEELINRIITENNHSNIDIATLQNFLAFVNTAFVQYSKNNTEWLSSSNPDKKKAMLLILEYYNSSPSLEEQFLEELKKARDISELETIWSNIQNAGLDADTTLKLLYDSIKQLFTSNLSLTGDAIIDSIIEEYKNQTGEAINEVNNFADKIRAIIDSINNNEEISEEDRLLANIITTKTLNTLESERIASKVPAESGTVLTNENDALGNIYTPYTNHGELFVNNNPGQGLRVHDLKEGRLVVNRGINGKPSPLERPFELIAHALLTLEIIDTLLNNKAFRETDIKFALSNKEGAVDILTVVKYTDVIQRLVKQEDGFIINTPDGEYLVIGVFGYHTSNPKSKDFYLQVKDSLTVKNNSYDYTLSTITSKITSIGLGNEIKLSEIHNNSHNVIEVAKEEGIDIRSIKWGIVYETGVKTINHSGEDIYENTAVNIDPDDDRNDLGKVYVYLQCPNGKLIRHPIIPTRLYLSTIDGEVIPGILPGKLLDKINKYIEEIINNRSKEAAFNLKGLLYLDDAFIDFKDDGSIVMRYTPARGIPTFATLNTTEDLINVLKKINPRVQISISDLKGSKIRPLELAEAGCLNMRSSISLHTHGATFTIAIDPSKVNNNLPPKHPKGLPHRVKDYIFNTSLYTNDNGIWKNLDKEVTDLTIIDMLNIIKSIEDSNDEGIIVKKRNARGKIVELEGRYFLFPTVMIHRDTRGNYTRVTTANRKEIESLIRENNKGNVPQGGSGSESLTIKKVPMQDKLKDFMSSLSELERLNIINGTINPDYRKYATPIPISKAHTFFKKGDTIMLNWKRAYKAFTIEDIDSGSIVFTDGTTIMGDESSEFNNAIREALLILAALSFSTDEVLIPTSKLLQQLTIGHGEESLQGRWDLYEDNQVLHYIPSTSKNVVMKLEEAPLLIQDMFAKLKETKIPDTLLGIGDKVDTGSRQGVEYDIIISNISESNGTTTVKFGKQIGINNASLRVPSSIISFPGNLDLEEIDNLNNIIAKDSLDNVYVKELRINGNNIVADIVAGHNTVTVNLTSNPFNTITVDKYKEAINKLSKVKTLEELLKLWQSEEFNIRNFTDDENTNLTDYYEAIKGSLELRTKADLLLNILIPLIKDISTWTDSLEVENMTKELFEQLLLTYLLLILDALKTVGVNIPFKLEDSLNIMNSMLSTPNKIFIPIIKEVTTLLSKANEIIVKKAQNGGNNLFDINNYSTFVSLLYSGEDMNTLMLIQLIVDNSLGEGTFENMTEEDLVKWFLDKNTDPSTITNLELLNTFIQEIINNCR